METNEENNDMEEVENVSQNEMALLNLQDLDETEIESIKGDTIGDTVYSAKWVISTLISLSKVCEEGWTDTLEESLCMLWDMTAEKDVVDFLMENNFLRIAECTCEISQENRLTEIIIGIIGNMCCHPGVLQALSETNKLISFIFDQLPTDDTETLIQVLRLLRAAVWDVQKTGCTNWLQHFKNCEFFGDALSFILQNSTNDNLLTAALELLQSISIVEIPEENCLLTDLFKVDLLVPALFESFGQLVRNQDGNHSHEDLKVIENWLTIFSNILQSEFRIFVINDTNAENFKKINEVFLRILQPLIHPADLMPIDERACVCIQDCVEMIFWFQRNKMYPDRGIVQTILTMMHGFRLVSKIETSPGQIADPDGTIMELQKYLETYWLETLRAYSESELLEIVRMCDNDVTKCLMEVATEYSTNSNDAVDKLLRVESLALQI